MPLEPRVYLHDILASCAAIQNFTSGKTLEEYLRSRLLRSAVERELSIIGEAVNQAVKLDPRLEQALSDVRLIVGFRNILIHNYARVRHEQVWEIAQVYVPKLLAETRAEIGRLTEEENGHEPR